MRGCTSLHPLINCKERRGEIEKGNIADLILVDCNFNVKKVILGGEIVK